MLIDLRNKGLTGKDAETALDLAGITVNKNTVPNEDKSPMVTSGIRIGTPAITTRGMKENEMKIIADFIDNVIKNYKDTEKLQSIRREIIEFTSKFPLFACRNE
jgi:glycine hydroxymethyltransferase